MRRPISAQTAKQFLTVHIRSNGCHHFLMVYNLLSRLQTLTLLLFPQTRQPASASTSCRARSHLPRPSPSLQITRRQPPHLPPTDPHLPLPLLVFSVPTPLRRPAPGLRKIRPWCDSVWPSRSQIRGCRSVRAGGGRGGGTCDGSLEDADARPRRDAPPLGIGRPRRLTSKVTTIFNPRR